MTYSDRLPVSAKQLTEIFKMLPSVSSILITIMVMGLTISPAVILTYYFGEYTSLAAWCILLIAKLVDIIRGKAD